MQIVDADDNIIDVVIKVKGISQSCMMSGNKEHTKYSLTTLVHERLKNSAPSTITVEQKQMRRSIQLLTIKNVVLIKNIRFLSTKRWLPEKPFEDSFLTNYPLGFKPTENYFRNLTQQEFCIATAASEKEKAASNSSSNNDDDDDDDDIYSNLNVVSIKHCSVFQTFV